MILTTTKLESNRDLWLVQRWSVASKNTISHLFQVKKEAVSIRTSLVASQTGCHRRKNSQRAIHCRLWLGLISQGSTQAMLVQITTSGTKTPTLCVTSALPISKQVTTVVNPNKLSSWTPSYTWMRNIWSTSEPRVPQTSTEFCLKLARTETVICLTRVVLARTTYRITCQLQPLVQSRPKLMFKS